MPIETIDEQPGPVTTGPHERGLAYQAALDGVRAVGILSVLLYHGGVGWAGGGFLGVEAFFVLSGFLITSLLLAEWHSDKTIKLSHFWARRARRLLPALFCVVAAIGAYEAIAGPSKAVPDLFADGLATLFYVGNWHQIWTGSNYFAVTAQQSPLLHTWSLAIEEQFYLLWPLVVLAIMKLGKGARHARVKILFAVAVAGSIASAVEMHVLYHGGAGIDRVYYGTDTRAQGLLAGAALACGLAWWRHSRSGAGQRSAPALGRWATAVLGALGVAGAGGVLWGMYAAGNTDGRSSALYSGGMLAFDAATVALIASVTLAPKAPLAWLLSTWPLRTIGKISYGLYLWHWPLFVWLTEQSTGLSGFELFALRVGSSFAVATASYFVIEQPIRQRRWSVKTVRSLAPVGACAAVAALVLAANVAPVAASGSGFGNIGSVVATVGGAGDTAATPPSSGAPSTTAPLPPSTGAPGTTAPAAVLQDPTTNSRATVNTTVPLDPVSWVGNQSCKVRLAVPAPYDVRVEYHTCPPVRVELIGDSMALTLGYGLESEQESYGVLMDDNAELGCSFGTKGVGDWTGSWQAQSSACDKAFQTWHNEIESFHAQAIVVMMGYWDCYDRLWDGQDVHIGEPAFDAYLYSQMVKFVQTEGVSGIPIVVLSVPWVDPPPLANGSPQPAASALRHSEINAMLARLARQFPEQVHVVDSDTYVSPGNHFDSEVNGHACRWSDGVHFETYCGQLMAPPVMALVRQLVEAQGGPGPVATKTGTAVTSTTAPVSSTTSTSSPS
ncbi:MAG: acyltransferase family protein [Acidimicrobiales bacterium]